MYSVNQKFGDLFYCLRIEFVNMITTNDIFIMH